MLLMRDLQPSSDSFKIDLFEYIEIQDAYIWLNVHKRIMHINSSFVWHVLSILVIIS